MTETPISEAVARLICPEAFRMRDEFIRSMDRLTSSTGATGDDIDRLREQVLELSRTTGLSVSGAADHLADLHAARELVSVAPTPRLQEQPVPDILADIDDTLADWGGSMDAMRWRPDGGAEAPDPVERASHPIDAYRFTAPTAGWYSVSRDLTGLLPDGLTLSCVPDPEPPAVRPDGTTLFERALQRQTPFDLGTPTTLSLPPWPPHMAGCWYARGTGWGRYGPDGREPVPAEVIADAGLPAEVDLPDGINVVFLHGQPFRNLIPRRRP